MVVKDVLTQKNLAEFFSEKVRSSIREQRAEVSQEVEFYLVQLLSYYAVSTNLFESNEAGGLEQRALALRFHDAIFDTRPGSQFVHLKKLGDTALYHAGVFYDGLCNQLVDVDYYINMGGRAYQSLANLSTASDKSLAEIFAELALNFPKLVEILYLCCESDVVRSNNDILRLIDRYVRTGSRKAEELLKEKGIATDILIRHSNMQ
jgi:hypothetical protein